jgi:superfamily I DNA/RNA helicase
LTVDTIHGVKGGEADNVVLMLDYTKAVKANVERNLDAELRCLYVAVTRAKKKLHIVYSSSTNGFDQFIRRPE